MPLDLIPGGSILKPALAPSRVHRRAPRCVCWHLPNLHDGRMTLILKLGLCRAVGTLAVALGVLLLTSCTYDVPLRRTVETTKTTSPIPVKVGVFFGSEFGNYRYVAQGSEPLPPRSEFVFPLGEASTAVFSEVFSSMFASSVMVPTIAPADLKQASVVGVIEPKIEEFHFEFPGGLLPFGDYRASITYRFTLRSAAGEPLGSWTVKGVGETPLQKARGHLDARTPTAALATDRAIQDAAVKLIKGFREVPEVRAWFRALNLQPQ